jgi:hypothetical protein
MGVLLGVFNKKHILYSFIIDKIDSVCDRRPTKNIGTVLVFLKTVLQMTNWKERSYVFRATVFR